MVFLLGVFHIPRPIVIVIVPHKVAKAKYVTAQAESIDGSLLDILKVVLLDYGLFAAIGHEFVTMEVLEPSILALCQVQLVLRPLLGQLRRTLLLYLL